MDLISIEEYENANVNMSDLVLKEIYGVYEKKNLTKEEIKLFYDYDENSLNTKSNKIIFVKNTIMTNIIKNCKGEKKRCKFSRRI